MSGLLRRCVEAGDDKAYHGLGRFLLDFGRAAEAREILRSGAKRGEEKSSLLAEHLENDGELDVYRLM